MPLQQDSENRHENADHLGLEKIDGVQADEALRREGTS
jgi:hypothetical protein